MIGPLISIYVIEYMYFVFRYEQLKHEEIKQTAKSLKGISNIVSRSVVIHMIIFKEKKMNFLKKYSLKIQNFVWYITNT